MTDWIVVTGVVWMLLVGTVIFLALCRISNAMEEEKLTRAGLPASNPVHVHLLHVIQSEDRTGIAPHGGRLHMQRHHRLHAGGPDTPGGVHKLMEILVLSVQ